MTTWEHTHIHTHTQTIEEKGGTSADKRTHIMRRNGRKQIENWPYALDHNIEVVACEGRGVCS